MAPLFAPLPTTPGGWPCIVADPPWPYNDKGSRLAPDQLTKRRARKGYRTVRVDGIAALPVREVVANDALLFLWVTDAHLVDGSAALVARAWGFEPKRTWTWVKRGAPGDVLGLLAAAEGWIASAARWAVDPEDRTRARADARALRRFVRETSPELLGGRLAFGGGHYVRTATERVLICRRGRAGFKVHDERDVFFAPRRRAATTGEVHSTKPPELLAKVERVCEGPRLELFARSERAGWVAWGNQVQTAREGRLTAEGDTMAMDGAPDRHQEEAKAAQAFDRAAMFLRCGARIAAMEPAREGMRLLRLCCEDEERVADMVALARARRGERVGA